MTLWRGSEASLIRSPRCRSASSVEVVTASFRTQLPKCVRRSGGVSDAFFRSEV